MRFFDIVFSLNYCLLDASCKSDELSLCVTVRFKTAIFKILLQQQQQQRQNSYP